MAEIAKKTKRYPTDLTDEEWRADRAHASGRGANRATPQCGFARGSERHSLPGAGGVRPVESAEEFRPCQTVY